jgi:hypothetical protein
MRFETTEERDTTMQYGVEEGAKTASRGSMRATPAATDDLRNPNGR